MPLTVVQMLPELESGGVERGTLELGEFLVRNGHDSRVVSGGGRLVSELEERGSRHVTLPVGKKTPQSLLCIPRLRRLFIRQRVDILHLRSRVPAWIGILTLKTLPKELRPRVVTTFHGFYSINRFSAVMAKGERVIAVSKSISEHIQTHYGVPEHLIRIIHRGVDPSQFNPDHISPQRVDALRRQWGLPETAPPVILMPARVTRLKGHDLLVRSLKRIDHLPWVAICAGELDAASSHVAELRSLIHRLKLDQRIKLVGHCHDMPAALKLSHVVVSASTRAESFGRIAVEAQAMGKPVIATAHGGSLETVLDRETGWLVPPEDDAAFAAVLGEAVSHVELRQAYGQRGRQWVREKFTIETMCRETVALYCELLSAKPLQPVPDSRTGV
jgi:glycosyltransferase involved in cell wall biosynthesis